MAILAALGTVLVGVLAGIWFMTHDHVLIGVVLALASLPFGLAIWIKVSDRM